MPIEFRCDRCEKKLRAPEGAIGKEAKCPSCGALITVPGADVEEDRIELAEDFPIRSDGDDESDTDDGRAEDDQFRPIAPRTRPIWAGRRISEDSSFWGLLLGSFLYPFAGNGPWIIGVGALFFAVAWALSYFMSLLGAIIGSLLLAYQVSAMMGVLSLSGAGYSEMPDWPSVTNLYDDVVRPCAIFFLPMLIYIGPTIILDAVGVEEWICWTVFGVGLLLMPMALLGITLSESAAALSPHIVIPAIMRIPLQYISACALLWATLPLGGVLSAYVESVPFLGGVLGIAVGLYLFAVQMRILGILYYANREKLRWFELE